MCCFELLILPEMEAHPGLFGIQMAATACLYNLTKGDLFQKIHPSILKLVMELTLTPMENFPNHYQVSTILNLCSWLPVLASAVCSSLLPITQNILSTVKLSKLVFVTIQQIWLINILSIKACYS
jgi:hypothetical protein